MCHVAAANLLLCFDCPLSAAQDKAAYERFGIWTAVITGIYVVYSAIAAAHRSGRMAVLPHKAGGFGKAGGSGTGAGAAPGTVQLTPAGAPAGVE
jgi:hypothetical protein